MFLYTILLEGTAKIAVSEDNSDLYVLEDMGFSYSDMNKLIEDYSEELKQKIEKALQKKSVNLAGKVSQCNLLSPIVHPKQDILCLGLNYFRDKSERSERGKDVYPYSSETVYFSKRVNEAVGPDGKILSHSDIVKKLDYEAELAVILGKDAYQVKPEEVHEYIFGYSIINDVSARDLQSLHKQWYFGKSLDGFTAMGPCIATPDEIKDVDNLRITCSVNGQRRQDGNTGLMIRSIGQTIAELTTGMTLKAGTIIAMGTPWGAAKNMDFPVFLKKGDEVVCCIEQIGTLRNSID